MKLAAAVALTLTLTLGGWLIHTQSSAGQQVGPQITNVVPPDFQPSAFSSPRQPARMTEQQAIDLVNRTYWNLSTASSVTAQYLNWSSPHLSRTDGRASYDHVDVWKVTASGLTVGDPGGGAIACKPGDTAETCPALRVWHHMVFIVDDKLEQVVEASPY